MTVVVPPTIEGHLGDHITEQPVLITRMVAGFVKPTTGLGGIDMRVIVCGSRDWTDRDLIRKELTTLREQYLPWGVTVIHGGNGYKDRYGVVVRGADLLAADEARKLGFTVREYKADWRRHGLAAGPLRNQRMLDVEKPHLVLAFHKWLPNSKGTKDMVERARKAGVPVRVIGGPDLAAGEQDELAVLRRKLAETDAELRTVLDERVRLRSRIAELENAVFRMKQGLLDSKARVEQEIHYLTGVYNRKV